MHSLTSDYAVRAILLLARRGTARAMRVDEISRETGAPRNYLAKTLNTLAKSQILTSARGPLGGFSLRVPPAELTLARITDCFDAPHAQRQCMLGSAPCNPDAPCDAHERWTEIQRRRRAPLTSTTVAELVA